jgi:hypothetical protein
MTIAGPEGSKAHRGAGFHWEEPRRHSGARQRVRAKRGPMTRRFYFGCSFNAAELMQ